MDPSRGFPKNPLRERPDPFRDPQGRNPFSDGSPPAPAPGENPYAASATVAGAASPPGAYEPWLPSRGGTVLTYGILGLTLSGLGAFLCGPGMLLTLFLSIMAISMARSDLAAMKAGAMTRDGRTLTVVGFWLGAAGAIITLLVGGGFAWFTLQQVFDN